MFILPDPTHPVNGLGEYDAGGLAGPGYSSVKLSSNQPVMKSRTHSGRVVTRAAASQYWNIDIGYNPMTRATLDILYSFLLTRRGGLLPFYVSLPQYSIPAMTVNPTVTSYTDPGSMTLAYSGGTVTPTRGSLFYIEDANDSAHTKTYLVTGVAGGVLSISPPLARATEAAAEIIFDDPLVRVVVSSDTQDYSLATNNLYTFSLKLEEAQI